MNVAVSDTTRFFMNRGNISDPDYRCHSETADTLEYSKHAVQARRNTTGLCKRIIMLSVGKKFVSVVLSSFNFLFSKHFLPNYNKFNYSLL